MDSFRGEIPCSLLEKWKARMPTRAQSYRLRKGRISETGRIYMISTATENRCPVFNDWQLGRLVVLEFKRAERQGLVTSLAWVVMPDHFHWLVELQQGSLASLIKQVKASSAVLINRASGKQGQLWQTGFHDKALRRDADLQKLARYIVANPLRAGLVNRIGDYPLWDAVWV